MHPSPVLQIVSAENSTGHTFWRRALFAITSLQHTHLYPVFVPWDSGIQLLQKALAPRERPAGPEERADQRAVLRPDQRATPRAEQRAVPAMRAETEAAAVAAATVAAAQWAASAAEAGVDAGETKVAETEKAEVEAAEAEEAEAEAVETEAAAAEVTEADAGMEATEVAGESQPESLSTRSLEGRCPVGVLELGIRGGAGEMCTPRKVRATMCPHTTCPISPAAKRPRALERPHPHPHSHSHPHPHPHPHPHLHPHPQGRTPTCR